MLSTLRNALKVPDLRKRLLFTLFLVAIFRLGNHIPVSGINTAKLTAISSTGLLGFYDLISGGAFSRFSIFSMGVIPYINSSIIIQLLTIAVPYLEQLSKEGEEGRRKIQEYTRYGGVLFGIIGAFGQYAIITNAGAVTDRSKFNMFVIIITVTTGSTFLMWLGDKITEKGIGNGISLLVFINIISRLPSQINQVWSLQTADTVSIIGIILFAILIAALLVGVIIMSLSERRIPVQYAGKTVGNKTYKAQTTHIPINMNNTGVIAIIFAMSVMQFPSTIANFWPTSKVGNFILNSNFSIFKLNSWPYATLYFVAVIFFSWFYTEVTFKPDEMAENMHKSSGFIPGIRPGEYTARYIEKVLTRVSIIGGLFAALIATFPIILEGYTKFKGISFSGTSLLILVGVALDTLRQLQSQLVMRHYQGFLK